MWHAGCSPWLRGGAWDPVQSLLTMQFAWPGALSLGRKGCLFLTVTEALSGLAVAFSKCLQFLLCGLVSRVCLYLHYSRLAFIEQIFTEFLLCRRHWVYTDEQTHFLPSWSLWSSEAYSVFLHDNWRVFFWRRLS